MCIVIVLITLPKFKQIEPVDFEICWHRDVCLFIVTRLINYA